MEKAEATMAIHIKTTNELPDGEGILFLTYAPGAPFQVLGRRCETTGELYLWSIIIGTLDSLPKIQARFGCELLKGKEAEDFLAAVAASDNPVYRAYVRSRH
jgi:hypothetical protein